MLKELYEAIRRDANPEQIVLDELTYTTGKVYPVLEELPSCLKVTTLTALVDYLKANVDGLNMGNLLCHVESPESVVILSSLSSNGFNQRKAFVRAKLEQLQLNLNTFIGGEAFNILLQSCFLEPEDPMKATDRGLVIKYASKDTPPWISSGSRIVYCPRPLEKGWGRKVLPTLYRIIGKGGMTKWKRRLTWVWVAFFVWVVWMVCRGAAA